MTTPICPKCKSSDYISLQGTVLFRYPLLDIDENGDDTLGEREEIDGTFKLDEPNSYYCAGCSTEYDLNWHFV